MSKRLAVMESTPKKVRQPQYVWEGVWKVEVENQEEVVTQLIAARDLQSAFFKARRWAKDNVLDTGRFVSLSQKEGMVV